MAVILMNISCSCRIAFRKAQLAARNNLARAQRLERELIIQSYSYVVSEASSPTSSVTKSQTFAPVVRQRQLQQQQSSLSKEDRQAVGASSDVTSSLRRTHELIAGELSRSEYAHQTLTESTAALAELNESYASLDGMLASSRNLLGTLLRSQKSDTWYLQTAFYMLVATGTWLVYRRLLYYPTWWLILLPLRLVYSTTVKVGSALVPGGASKNETEVVAGQPLAQVEGLPDETLPIAKVGEDGTPQENTDSDPDSMVHKVGKIIDEAQKRDGTVENEKPTPVMLKETVGVQGANLNRKPQLYNADAKKAADGAESHDEL
jgi:protein transport protein SEC20